MCIGRMWGELRRDYETPVFFRDISQDDLLSMTHNHWGVGHDAHGPTWIGMVKGRKMWFLGKPNTPRPERASV